MNPKDIRRSSLQVFDSPGRFQSAKTLLKYKEDGESVHKVKDIMNLEVLGKTSHHHQLSLDLMAAKQLQNEKASPSQKSSDRLQIL